MPDSSFPKQHKQGESQAALTQTPTQIHASTNDSANAVDIDNRKHEFSQSHCVVRGENSHFIQTHQVI